ncbi:hypothetical protein ABI_04620 [Asticcacaulis biprosthecium C19]|uniref:Phage envelope protein n=1 Tax=Asticcacaulis biprosthecium C19 TaxID=715226 RepID=F4QK03_9CAUL|nr:DUF1398 family protein [Asticcacaulis biprosthecium]EGF92030.1 hypothetical protein ABI_04620 [Asticcacaulis biprosthecium C19]
MTPFREAAERCTLGSDEERLSFPAVLARLAAVGVERYHADLQRAEKTYYLANGQSEVIPTLAMAEQAAAAFDAASIEAAVRASQSGAIKYKEFCLRILKAGCVAYLVSLAGRRAVYYGRTGETHIELFPN